MPHQGNGNRVSVKPRPFRSSALPTRPPRPVVTQLAEGLTLMPSHRDTALRGRRARSVLKDLMALTLPIPAPSIASMKIDNCKKQKKKKEHFRTRERRGWERGRERERGREGGGREGGRGKGREGGGERERQRESE